jgi:hypothetical protein
VSDPSRLEALLHEANPWWRDPAARPRVPPFRRDLQKRVVAHTANLADRRGLVVFGPRQVGKTVLLRQSVADLLELGWPSHALTYFDFSDHRLAHRPTLDDVVASAGSSGDAPHVYLFDETEYAGGDWGRWLKHEVDNQRSKVVLTSSAATHLREHGRESGVGRWIEHLVEPLTFAEYVKVLSGRDTELEQLLQQLPADPFPTYLQVGGFPEHAGRDVFTGEAITEIRRRLRQDIADRAIRRDLARHNVDVERVSKLFLYLVEDSGCEFNASQRAQDLGADARSVRDWLQLLLDSCLICKLPRDGASARQKLRAHPKLYACDHGLVAAFTPSPPLQALSDEMGPILETMVYRHLRELSDVGLSYFRTKKGDVEADFVVADGRARVVVEVTASTRLRPRKYQQLRKAMEAAKAERAVLIYAGLDADYRDDLTLMPLREFLIDPRRVISRSAS